MEVSQMYPLGDTVLIDTIVGQLKSQGIFDQFRKECIADVDTKPAYQNLQQRVETTVANFLEGKTWCPDLNKNQLRDSLRKHIHEMGFLETGVERIVDQVVNPKVYTVFMPQVEDVVYSVQGIPKPEKKNIPPPSSTSHCGTPGSKPPGMLFTQPPPFLPGHAFLPPALQNHMQKPPPTLEDLLPTDLDPVSPESGKSSPDIKDEHPDENSLLDDSGQQNSTVVKEHDESLDSQLSGFSDLTSHGSDHGPSPTPPKKSDKIVDSDGVLDEDSHLSKVSSGSRLSFISSEDKSQDAKEAENLIKNEPPTTPLAENDATVQSSPQPLGRSISPSKSPVYKGDATLCTPPPEGFQTFSKSPDGLPSEELLEDQEEELSTEVVPFMPSDYTTVPEMKEQCDCSEMSFKTELEDYAAEPEPKLEEPQTNSAVHEDQTALLKDEPEKKAVMNLDENSLALSEDSQSSGASDNKLHIDETKEVNLDSSNHMDEQKDSTNVILNDDSTSLRDPHVVYNDTCDPDQNSASIVETCEEARHGFEDSQDAVQPPPLPPSPPPPPPEDSRSGDMFSPVPETPRHCQWSPEEEEEEEEEEGEFTIQPADKIVDNNLLKNEQHAKNELELDEISGSDSESMQLAWSPLSVHGEKDNDDGNSGAPIDVGGIAESEQNLNGREEPRTGNAPDDEKLDERKGQSPNQSRERKKDDRHKSSDRHKEDRHSRHRDRDKSRDDKTKEKRREEERSSSSRRHDQKSSSKSKDGRERKDSSSKSRYDDKSRSDKERSSSHHKTDEKKRDERKDERDKTSSSRHKSSRPDDRHRHDKDRDRKSSTSRHDDKEKEKSSSARVDEKSRSSKSHPSDRDRDREKDRRDKDKRSEKDKDRKERDKKHDKEKENLCDKESSRNTEKRRDKDRNKERKDKSSDACRQNNDRRSTDRDSNNGSMSTGNGHAGADPSSGIHSSQDDVKDDPNKSSGSSDSDSKSSSGQNNFDSAYLLTQPGSPIVTTPSTQAQTASVSPPSSLPFKKRPLLPEKDDSDNPEVFSCINSKGKLVLKIKKPKMSHDKRSRKSLSNFISRIERKEESDVENSQTYCKEMEKLGCVESQDIPDTKYFKEDWPMKAEGEAFLSFVHRLEQSEDLAELSDYSVSSEVEEVVSCPLLDGPGGTGQMLKLVLQLLPKEEAEKVMGGWFPVNENRKVTCVSGLEQKVKNRARQSVLHHGHGSEVKRRKQNDSEIPPSSMSQKSRRPRKPNKRYSSEEFTSNFEYDDEEDIVEPEKLHYESEDLKKEKSSLPAVLPTIRESPTRKSMKSDPAEATRHPSCSWSAEPYLSNSEDEGEDKATNDSELIGTALKNLMMESGLGGPEEASAIRKPSTVGLGTTSLAAEGTGKKTMPLSGVKRVGLSRNYKGGAFASRSSSKPVAASTTADGFPLPLSPESDVSASSSDKGTCGKSNKESHVDVSCNGIAFVSSARRSEQSRVKQHYDCDDLYKPRPLLRLGSRRRQASNINGTVD